MILDTIVAQKKIEVAELRKKGIGLPPEFRDKVIGPPRGFTSSLIKYPEVAIIAEVKKASPSKGVICADFRPVDIAVNYQQNGAQAISVLTDVQFFQGALLYMMQVREAVSLPVLRKDFIIDALQIEEARLHGADAILLIAAILDLSQLRDYQACAAEYGMDVLIEVHDEWETELALEAGGTLIGINNRNLKDFSMDIETTFRLKKYIPAEIPVVSESGLKTVDDFRRLRDEGISAALIGETLMRAGADSSLLQSARIRVVVTEERTMLQRTRVKMCGTRHLDDALAAVRYGVDALGFIFYARSPRCISGDAAAQILQKLPPFVDRVAVLVNASIPELVSIAGLGFSHVQLHGNESAEYCRQIRQQLPAHGIIKAFRVGEESRAEDFIPYNDCVDAFLLDTYVQGARGGTGQIFDWSMIERLNLQRPVILAGGLSPENVVDAIAMVHPFAVDINSGVESQPGVKDHARLQQLLRLVYQTVVA